MLLFGRISKLKGSKPSSGFLAVRRTVRIKGLYADSNRTYSADFDFKQPQFVDGLVSSSPRTDLQMNRLAIPTANNRF
jgi:hypothetical protein